MTIERQQAAIWLTFLASLSIAACGGGGGGTNNPPPPTKSTPTVTIAAGQNLTTVQSVAVTVTVNGAGGTPTGSVTLSSGSYNSAATLLSTGSAQISIPAGTLVAGTNTLNASYSPDPASSSAYNSATGTGQVTITKATPDVTVTPNSSNSLGPQPLSVSVTVAPPSGSASSAPLPGGTVVLSSGSYTSAQTTLSSGSATVVVPAGALAASQTGRSNTLTANYAPDTPGSATYENATGTGSVNVSLVTPTVTVSPASSSINAGESLSVMVTVAWGSGNPAPTGSVTLNGGGYASSAITLTNGSATIDIPANSLSAGNVTLTANYTPDAASTNEYAKASGQAAPVAVSAVTYTLTVDSTLPSSGVAISASPADNNGKSSGITPFTLTYNSGAQVTLTAINGTYTFVSWAGCTPGTGPTCTISLNSNATVTATYNYSSITSISVSPSTATIGTQQQFTATVNGTGSYNKAVTWTVAAPSGSSLSPGNISSSGLYNTPYPAPPTVTVTATSVQDTSVNGSAIVTLSPPATATGPALTVDVNTPNTPSENPHNISPYVYGMNAYVLDTASEKIANPGILRWGGDDISRYNYQNNMTNSASDYYFENFLGAANQFPNATSGTNFTQFFSSADATGSAALGTVPVNGWVANSTQYACSFTKSAYPGQQSYNGNNCGNGVYPQGTNGCTSSSGCSIYGSDTVAAITSIQETPPSILTAPAPGSVTASWANGTWSGGWVNSIVSNASYGNGASRKGVAIWDLDNEPTWWDAVHRDVHPNPFTYDEVTNNGIGTALAIKTADPTALISGPVIDWWWAYFYSKKDVESGWSSGSCYQPWSNPTDREAHGGVPLIEYYLQQFAKYSSASYYNTRLLDYLDIHGYFAPNYNGNSVAFTTAGDTQEQNVRMNGTRVFWDPTYTDPNYPQPNYLTDSNYTTSCSPPAQAPELIPMLQSWVAKDYSGTKTAIDEYNFGGLESINGAIVQADILGIFGRQGLDMGAFWPSTNYSAQSPGNYAFAMYRNYDLANDGAVFGDVYLYATSTAPSGDGEGQLAVYGAQRTSDSAITIMVINKTYGSLTSTISLKNFSAASGTSAQVYQYSNANLGAIVPQAAASVTPPTGGGTTSSINYTFPAQSITLFVVPD
jgi:Glycoside hydrolase family 44